jgi:hypothetical protein
MSAHVVQGPITAQGQVRCKCFDACTGERDQICSFVCHAMTWYGHILPRSAVNDRMLMTKEETYVNSKHHKIADRHVMCGNVVAL